MKKKPPEAKQVPTPPTPGVVNECTSFFGNHYGFDIMKYNPDPYVFNQRVNVRKYKVTIELLDEPLDVIQQRIVDLWETSSNYHHMGPIKEEAEVYGCKHLLVPEKFGSRKTKEQL